MNDQMLHMVPSKINVINTHLIPSRIVTETVQACLFAQTHTIRVYGENNYSDFHNSGSEHHHIKTGQTKRTVMIAL